MSTKNIYKVLKPYAKFIFKKSLLDEREPAIFPASMRPEVIGKKNLKTPFGTAVENFYMTDSITRESKIMAQCIAMLLKK